MNTSTPEIVPGSTVTLHFSLSLTDGTEAISTFNEDPLTFQMGDKTFQPTMEMALYGLKAGDKQTLTLTPEQAYGEPDPGLIQQMPLSDFQEVAPELDHAMSFMLPNGEETLGVIRKITEDQITVDFNHPMAGMDVTFKVEILNVGT